MSTALSGWLHAFRIYAHPRVLGMLSLGFSAGLPLLLVLGTLSFWLREAGIDRSTIGHLSWIGLAYGFKWLWSPLVDRLSLPLLTRLLGRRRAWLLLSQIVITIALAGMASTDPIENLTYMVFFALAVAFASATQDIALDAYRIEAVAPRLQGAMAATYQAGYRVAMILASAGVLWIAAAVDPSEATYDYAPWRTAYLVMAVCMGVGIITTLIIREPEVPVTRLIEENENHARGIIAHWNLNARLAQILAWLYGAMIAPFRDFIVRHGRQALVILALIALYRISDVVMGVMSNPFYVDMGYTKDEVATISKVYGVIMTIAGAAIGGVLTAKIGVMRTLFLGAVLSAATNLLFVWLSGRGHDVTGLIFTISADNLSGGIASSAFIAYLSGLTNSAYSATQYALFSSVMLLLPKFIAGFSGEFVDAYGYASFFTGTALLGLPVLVLVWLAGQARFKTMDSPPHIK
ncbi:PAT family beta-lactamase induction signal transducer AmpG [Nitrosospira sp. Nsp5]|uniref:MFS transporter, PAT family, beta-lactamase induction signal transducer AmpG n=1 Tax=Nitrosospira multiformis TaxID=1231 RepID=A0ABY0T691_9PROT|nr:MULTISPECIES: MFS transporter [Nitrosospira]PTR05730.1 PAT family beta-lactamase induction signal transducer AmpG [Nitrosospira sp. Nsp5]SDQ31531.1 MFS transporter, PAT family, beta-lactamase induction signal transducer AmpG [Nitrosospira multiformis]